MHNLYIRSSHALSDSFWVNVTDLTLGHRLSKKELFLFMEAPFHLFGQNLMTGSLSTEAGC